MPTESGFANAQMDEMDHRILAELGRDQILMWGATDPRLRTAELAEKLRVDPNTVRARLRAWKRAGFLRGFVALPNPRLFGVGVSAGGVRVRRPREKRQVLDDLGLVDGMLSAMDYVGEWIGLGFVDDGKAALERRLRLLARVPGVAEVQPPLVWNAPPAKRDPTPLEWRILDALREADARERRAHELAASVGVSANTFRAHYDALVRSGAVWSLPELDFTRWSGAPVARLVLRTHADVPAAQTLRRVRSHVADAMAQPAPRTQDGVHQIVSVLVQRPSVGAIEDLALELEAEEGVLDVEVLHPKLFRVYRAWADERRAASTSR